MHLFRRPRAHKKIGLAIVLLGFCVGVITFSRQHSSNKSPAPNESTIAEAPSARDKSTIAATLEKRKSLSAGPVSEISESTAPAAQPVAAGSVPTAAGVANSELPIQQDRRVIEEPHSAKLGTTRLNPTLPRVNRPLDLARLMQAVRDRYELDHFDDPTREFEVLRQRADAGDADAAFALGLLLAYGEPETNDPLLAAKEFARAANAGLARASAELGRLYLTGSGMPADPARAEELFAAAWAAGDPEGAFLLATGHRLALFAESEPTRAEPLLVAAAERGHVAAARTLFALMRDGNPAVSDPRVIGWLQTAAESGDADALMDLAGFYLLRTEGDKAYSALEAAAETGSANALLGMLALSGTSMRDPVARARVRKMLEIHAANSELGAARADVALAFLELSEPDRPAATARARQHLQRAGDRNDYRAKIAAQHLDEGRALVDALREYNVMSEEQAYVRWLELSPLEYASPASGKRPPLVRVVVNPKYPVELLAERLTGKAVVSFIVLQDGGVADVHVVEATHPAFAAAAEAAVRQWKFSPGLKNGAPVNVQMQLPLYFQTAQ